MAEIYCKQSCRQRYVLEKLAYSLETITGMMDSKDIHAITAGSIHPAPVIKTDDFDPSFPALAVPRPQSDLPLEQESVSDEFNPAGQDFPALGVPRKQKPSSAPFIQIDSGSVIISAEDDE